MKNGRSAVFMLDVEGKIGAGFPGGPPFGVACWIERHANEPEYEILRNELSNGRIFGYVKNNEWNPLEQPVQTSRDSFLHPFTWHVHNETPIPESFRPYEQGKDNTDAFLMLIESAKNGDRSAAARLLSTFFVYLNDPHIMPEPMRKFLITSFIRLMSGEDARDVFMLKTKRGRKRRPTPEEIQIALKVEDLIPETKTQVGACRLLLEREPELTARYQVQKGKEEPAAGLRRIHNRYKDRIRYLRSFPVSPGHLLVIEDVCVKIEPPAQK